MSLESRPALARGSRLQFDEVRGDHNLLFPEGVVRLNSTAVEVLGLCDGTRTVAAIIDLLQEKYVGADIAADVRELIASIAATGLIVVD